MFSFFLTRSVSHEYGKLNSWALNIQLHLASGSSSSRGGEINFAVWWTKKGGFHQNKNTCYLYFYLDAKVPTPTGAGTRLANCIATDPKQDFDPLPRYYSQAGNTSSGKNNLCLISNPNILMSKLLGIHWLVFITYKDVLLLIFRLSLFGKQNP